jgi:hypothetical protein
MDWDRAESWEVQRVHATRLGLRAHVANVADLARVRELMPELRDVPPAELRGRVLNGVLDLGEFGTIEGPRILATARDLGLQVDAERRTTVSHICFNRTRRCAVLVEDPAAAERLAAEMLAASVPLVLVEVD